MPKKIYKHELEPAEKKKRKKRLLLLLLFALVAAALGGFWWWKSQQHPLLVSGLPNIKHAQKMSEAQMKKYAQKKVDESQVTIQVFSEINMDKDGKTGKMWVQNPPTNKTGQQAKLRLKAKNEEIFDSGLIKPGQQISKLTLDKSLPAGDYDAIIDLYFYDLDSKQQVGKSTIDAVIHVP